MKRVRILLSAFFCLLLLGACKKEEEYVYPNVISTFIDVATDANGTVQIWSPTREKSCRYSTGKDWTD